MEPKVNEIFTDFRGKQVKVCVDLVDGIVCVKRCCYWNGESCFSEYDCAEIDRNDRENVFYVEVSDD